MINFKKNLPMETPEIHDVELDTFKKINELVTKALHIPKKRKPSKVPQAVIEKRMKNKKIKGEIKELRKRVDE